MEEYLFDLRRRKVFLFEAFFFALALFLGILNGLVLKQLFILSHIYPSSFSIGGFLLWFFAFTGFILWFVYFVKSRRKKRIFFKILFLSSVVLGNILFFNIWLPGLLSILVAIFLLGFWLKKRLVLVHNLFLILAVSAIGARLGLSLRPETVIILLAVFSVYDWIAVYKTKHMVKIAKEMINQQSIVGIVIPSGIKGFLAELREVKAGGRFIILGAGDIVFPLMLSVSVIPQGFGYSLIIALFSLVGLLLDFLVFTCQDVRKPMPALPLIALLSIIGYLITRII